MTAEAEAAPAASPAVRGKSDYFLPDFCEPRMVLAVVLIAELLALVLALARPVGAGFLTELARISVFVQWAGLTTSALICSLAGRLQPLPARQLTLVLFALLGANIVVLSALAVVVGNWLDSRGLGAGLFPAEFWPFVLRNVAVALIVGALLLRYFFVSDQWRRHVRAEASARIDALHARIRPHFLFNSLNTIAALTRSNAVRAEEAIEDLSDLFRATLRDGDAMITLKEELELARIYQRIESLRLGDRLRVEWKIESLPMRLKVPSLTVQPLLENAINHGIEPIPEGGTIRVEGRVVGAAVQLVITNPAPPEAAATSRPGNRIALHNIRDRLRLGYGERAALAVSRDGGHFRVELTLPVDE